jgi:LacI family transcriptional regulator
MVMSGIEDHLLREGYFYFVASHRHRPDLIEEYPKLLLARAADGLIAVDTPGMSEALPIPVVTISGHKEMKGVSNIVLDHGQAAALALLHLVKLKHRRVAFIKGQAFSSDTAVRWNAIREQAKALDLAIYPELTTQLRGDVSTPDLGYHLTQKLIKKGEQFTALFSFNDISAIGAIRALREAGLRVPEDVSVVGFDDIQGAAYQNPGLTTVRQPLRKMGVIAAECLLKRIAQPGSDAYPRFITVEPELIVRESTGWARVGKKGRGR